MNREAYPPPPLIGVSWKGDKGRWEEGEWRKKKEKNEISILEHQGFWVPCQEKAD
jgi:hypothetical protein